ncbi:IS5-like element ISAha1 family transposase [Acinetobacter johnsonii]|jgi:IS5 family transposase|nr:MULTISPECIES: IS5-like element ISAha1 family transposase [Acinetobacter]MDD0801171.1 IS5-like element ISAha1 family transposase [Acinetobacter sp. Gutcm_16]MDD0801711.1 IS5-like element ISAha1 family transposase [Acinetobacter sp. Gutcm_16]MDD0801963.1 IS5-like element ISAha1 family transposase [Acinetobacter sp. Gutcm_16]MDD0802175.1 IS5-like element ISAha1 family transposase [Acinetobacter sp. Gutcm_16]MDD0802195.1 IS5-like element ISAha1 family transposase [Acinetobacter sp. Gutcm_16]
MNKPTPKIYRTTNWSSYNSALINRGNLSIWFDPKTQWYAQPKGKHGRNQTYSDTAIQCCLMIKSLFHLSLRMVTGFVQSLIHLCRLDWTAPDYSTICRRQKHIDIAINYQKSSNGLQLLVDSTGLKFLGEGEWKRKKHQPEYRRQWRKLHIGIDAETLQIRAIQLTTNNVSDSQVLGDLLDQIPQDEQIDSVYTDGAYDTKQCRQVIADRQAHAVIPPRKNAKPWKDTKTSSLERNELLRTVKRLGRTIWKNWSGYHRRSLIETKMHCIKLLGDKLRARNFQSQVNEIHARVAVLNKFTDLGRPHTQVAT